MLGGVTWPSSIDAWLTVGHVLVTVMDTVLPIQPLQLHAHALALALALALVLRFHARAVLQMAEHRHAIASHSPRHGSDGQTVRQVRYLIYGIAMCHST
jgi:hypothetical protein